MNIKLKLFVNNGNYISVTRSKISQSNSLWQSASLTERHAVIIPYSFHLVYKPLIEILDYFFMLFELAVIECLVNDCIIKLFN